eukprot:GCRY01001591.1.p1 GENE.GCRY01001591.1~~GCRY01001591.1.p1  ORF type:complete len:593 (+),score=125.15 GCRY01001591.1:219-1997(+)
MKTSLIIFLFSVASFCLLLQVSGYTFTSKSRNQYQKSVEDFQESSKAVESQSFYEQVQESIRSASTFFRRIQKKWKLDNSISSSTNKKTAFGGLTEQEKRIKLDHQNWKKIQEKLGPGWAAAYNYKGPVHLRGGGGKAQSLHSREAPAVNGNINNTECYSLLDGRDYRGTVAVTKSGKPCQRWTQQFPQPHSRRPEDFPGAGLGDHNYCRNPDGDSFVWCMLETPQPGYVGEWDYCYLPEYSPVDSSSALIGTVQPCIAGVCGPFGQQIRVNRTVVVCANETVEVEVDGVLTNITQEVCNDTTVEVSECLCPLDYTGFDCFTPNQYRATITGQPTGSIVQASDTSFAKAVLENAGEGDHYILRGHGCISSVADDPTLPLSIKQQNLFDIPICHVIMVNTPTVDENGNPINSNQAQEDLAVSFNFTVDLSLVNPSTNASLGSFSYAIYRDDTLAVSSQTAVVSLVVNIINYNALERPLQTWLTLSPEQVKGEVPIEYSQRNISAQYFHSGRLFLETYLLFEANDLLSLHGQVFNGPRWVLDRSDFLHFNTPSVSSGTDVWLILLIAGLSLLFLLLVFLAFYYGRNPSLKSKQA